MPYTPGTDIKSYIYNGLRNRGLDHVRTIAAMANAGAESAFNPSAYNSAGGGQGAHGLWQWRGSRYTGLKDKAANSGLDVSDPDVQMDWLMDELRGGEKNTMAALEGIEDPSEAARIFRTTFERPGGHGYESTAKHAGELSSMFTGNGPWKSDSVEEKRSRLFDFSNMADAQSEKFYDFASSMLDTNIEKAQLPKQPEGLSFGLPMPETMAFRDPNNMPEFSFGEDVSPAETASVSTSNAPDTPPQGAKGGSAEADEPSGFAARMGKILFPKSEDPQSSFKTLIGGIGVGLGQMSQGQTVDLQPFFANVAAKKQAIIQSEAAAEQQAYDNQMARYNADTSRMNAETAAKRLEIDAYEAAKKGAPGVSGLSPETMKKYADNPKYAPFIEMVAHGDADAMKVGMQGIKDQIISDYKDAAPTAQAASARADLVDAIQRDDAGAIVDIMRSNPELSVKDLKDLKDAVEPDRMMRLAKAMVENKSATPEIVDTARELMKIEAGVSDSELDKMNVTDGRKFQDRLNAGVASGSSLGLALKSALNTSLDAKRAGRDISGAQESYFSPALQALQMTLPADWSNKLNDMFGLDPTEFQKLDAATKYIALAAARPMLQGTGSITENERASIVAALPNTAQTFEARMDLLNRLDVLNKFDIASAKYYADHKGGPLHSNYENASNVIASANGEALPELYKSQNLWFAYTNRNLKDTNYNKIFTRSDGSEMPAEDVFRMIAPNLTMEHAVMLQDLIQGGVWINRDTGELMRGTKPIKPN